jgi:hypothetical protein
MNCNEATQFSMIASATDKQVESQSSWQQSPRQETAMGAVQAWVTSYFVFIPMSPLSDKSMSAHAKNS